MAGCAHRPAVSRRRRQPSRRSSAHSPSRGLHDMDRQTTKTKPSRSSPLAASTACEPPSRARLVDGRFAGIATVSETRRHACAMDDKRASRGGPPLAAPDSLLFVAAPPASAVARALAQLAGAGVATVSAAGPCAPALGPFRASRRGSRTPDFLFYKATRRGSHRGRA